MTAKLVFFFLFLKRIFIWQLMRGEDCTGADFEGSKLDVCVYRRWGGGLIGGGRGLRGGGGGFDAG